jgi:hypothetical protein
MGGAWGRVSEDGDSECEAFETLRRRDRLPERGRQGRGRRVPEDGDSECEATPLCLAELLSEPKRSRPQGNPSPTARRGRPPEAC